MELLGSFFLSFVSYFSPGGTSAVPAEPLHRSISRWILGTIILTAAGWLTWLIASHQRGVSSSSAGPTIEQIHQLAELVTAKVTIADARETNLSGYLGGVKAILVVRGDALLGPDLSQAKIVSCDRAKRVMVIELPRPHLISYRLDHSATKLVSLSHDGLWVIVPGDAGRTAVLNRAYVEAERAVAAAAVTPETINDAAEHAEQALAAFFGSGGGRCGFGGQPSDHTARPLG
jgi:hypothetical protein